MAKLSRFISEQHLFYLGTELENDKTLADYRINPTDVLQLKVIIRNRIFYNYHFIIKLIFNSLIKQMKISIMLVLKVLIYQKLVLKVYFKVLKKFNLTLI